MSLDVKNIPAELIIRGPKTNNGLYEVSGRGGPTLLHNVTFDVAIFFVQSWAMLEVMLRRDWGVGKDKSGWRATATLRDDRPNQPLTRDSFDHPFTALLEADQLQHTLEEWRATHPKSLPLTGSPPSD